MKVKRHVEITAFLILCFSLFACTSVAKELKSLDSDNRYYDSQIKLEFIFGGVQYERIIGKRTSLNFGLQYSPKVFSDPNEYDFQLTPEMRIYLSNRSLVFEGFYLGPYLFYKDYIVARDVDWHGTIKYSVDLVTTSGLGLKTGYSSELFKSVILDISLGLGYNLTCSVVHKKGFPIIDEASHYFNFTGGIAIGYAF